MATQVQALVSDVTGAMQSKFGPASKVYFAAKKAVAIQRQYGNLNESKILEYARARKFEETTVGLSMLCALPVYVVERVLVDKGREVVLILAKALGFCWETTMSLLFLGRDGPSDHLTGTRSPADRICRSQHRDIEKRSEVLSVAQACIRRSLGRTSPPPAPRAVAGIAPGDFRQNPRIPAGRDPNPLNRNRL